MKMFTVSNRIKVKKGFGAKMAPAFTSGEDLSTFEGFVKVEVNVSTTNEAYDELNVMTYWETLEQFETWRASDSFKNAHKRDGGADHGASPVLSNEIVIAEILSTQSAAV